jgi:hypothetical protein
MICEDYDAGKLTFNQLVANTFEMKSTLEKGHVDEILFTKIGRNIEYPLPERIDRMVLMIEDDV